MTEVKKCNVVDLVDRLAEGSRQPVERRVGWTGMTAAEAARPGAALLAALFQKANEDGLQLKELAAALDVTYGYIHQLKTGMRETTQVGDEFVSSCARYLNKPRLYVLALAGKLSLADFIEPASIEGDLDTAIQVMYRDEKWGGFMPLSLRSLDQKERLFIVRLYEAATGKRLMQQFDPTGIKDIK